MASPPCYPVHMLPPKATNLTHAHLCPAPSKHPKGWQKGVKACQQAGRQAGRHPKGSGSPYGCRPAASEIPVRMTLRCSRTWLGQSSVLKFQLPPAFSSTSVTLGSCSALCSSRTDATACGQGLGVSSSGRRLRQYDSVRTPRWPSIFQIDADKPPEAAPGSRADRSSWLTSHQQPHGNGARRAPAGQLARSMRSSGSMRPGSAPGWPAGPQASPLPPPAVLLPAKEAATKRSERGARGCTRMKRLCIAGRPTPVTN